MLLLMMNDVRFQACVDETGSHFQHLLWYLGSNADSLCGQPEYFLACAMVTCNLLECTIVLYTILNE